MSIDPFEQDVDDLLADLHRIIDEEPADADGELLRADDFDIDHAIGTHIQTEGHNYFLLM